MSLWFGAIHKFVSKRERILTKNEDWLALGVGTLVVVPTALLYLAPVVAIYLNAASIITLIGLSLLHEKARKIAIAATIIPISFMVFVSLPKLSDFVKIAWLYGTIMLLSLTYRFLFLHDKPKTKKRPKQASGDYLMAIPQALAMGLTLGGIAFSLVPRNLPFESFPPTLVVGAIVVFALVEIAYFQGLLQSNIASVIGPLSTVMLTTLLFASFSASNFQTLILGLLAGASFAIFYHFKQRVLPVMLANVAMKLTFVCLVITSVV